MVFPFENCIVSAESFSTPQARDLLEYQHGMTCNLLDLQKFEEEMQKHGEEKIVARYLSSREQEHLGRLTSSKRKREWLGGRFAAKYAAAALHQSGNALPWSNLIVLADENGRPYLAADAKSTALPDISISHSGSLVAAMAVNKGLCGIDIQKVTPRVVKVRERFCSQGEEHILHSFFSTTPQKKQTSALTKMWAAKEALRKIANTSSLPGFMELELTEINNGPSCQDSALWKFIFTWKQIDRNGNPVSEKRSVAVCLIADYALALTTRNDTVG